MLRYHLTVRHKNHVTATRDFRTIESAYTAYDAAKSGYPNDTLVELWDRVENKTIALYKNYYRDRNGHTCMFDPING